MPEAFAVLNYRTASYADLQHASVRNMRPNRGKQNTWARLERNPTPKQAVIGLLVLWRIGKAFYQSSRLFTSAA